MDAHGNGQPLKVSSQLCKNVQNMSAITFRREGVCGRVKHLSGFARKHSLAHTFAKGADCAALNKILPSKQSKYKYKRCSLVNFYTPVCKRLDAQWWLVQIVKLRRKVVLYWHRQQPFHEFLYKDPRFAKFKRSADLRALLVQLTRAHTKTRIFACLLWNLDLGTWLLPISHRIHIEKW